MTITEALAELKTITNRIAKKREGMVGYLLLPAQMKDPLTEGGGSKEFIKREDQAIRDLESRIVKIRSTIQMANHATMLTIENQTMSIADWLTWRKEVVDGRKRAITSTLQIIHRAREERRKVGAVVGGEVTGPTDVVVNVDEASLLKEAEQLETILGVLDGQLSLKNATVDIQI